MNKNFWLGMLLSKLCVAVGPMLAVCGITVDQSVFVPQAVGALLTVGGFIGSMVSHARALQTPSTLKALAVAALCGGTLCFSGCAIAPLPSTTGAAPAATAPTTGATIDQDLLNFALTAQNVIQHVNTGVEIIAPVVSDAASAAELVVHGAQSTAILNKIVAVSNQVSAAGVAAGLPPSVIQAQVSAVNTPAVAAAIVQQVQATVPAALPPPTTLWLPGWQSGDEGIAVAQTSF
jgi:hypothetical protein